MRFKMSDVIEAEYEDVNSISPHTMVSDAVTEAPAVEGPPVMTTWRQLLDSVAAPTDTQTKVSLCELHEGGSVSTALVVAGPEQKQVMQYLLQSLDKLFSALDEKQPQV
jgi:hypothetical protein